MIEVRDRFLGLGWTEGWAVAGAISVGVVCARLVTELLRLIWTALLSKVSRPKQKSVATVVEALEVAVDPSSLER